jgi:uncharacterized membrane protein (GlpM family)
VKPELAPSQLNSAHAWEYIVRFGFGGAITACTGLVAHAWGPVIAGLFLAFPAILPASLTLVKQHDGRRQAMDDARGACLGSIALVAFAVVAMLTCERLPAAVALAFASAAWLAAAIALWSARYAKA